MKSGLLLYGANGYTGKLILETALRHGLQPVLAGRRQEAIEPLAKAHGLPFRVFALEDPAAVAKELEPFTALLLAAGPFSQTSAPAFAGCLSARTAYLDITGEIDVFEALFARDAEARAAGIAVLPGVGFDVVPTDCLAASLARALPTAKRLTLAFRAGKVSPGTLKTMIEGIPHGGRARVNGRIVKVPSAWKTRAIPFPDGARMAMTIPWGDVSTAYHSTRIPDIEVYLATSPKAIAGARRTRLLGPLLGLPPVQALLKARAAKLVGPGEAERKVTRSTLWGRAEDDTRAVTGTLETLEGYTLTAETSVRAAARVLAGGVGPGVQTPSMAFGPGFVEEVPGTVMRIERPMDARS
jgi:short subunit dehydrogenase-like uncharacterized protein